MVRNTTHNLPRPGELAGPNRTVMGHYKFNDKAQSGRLTYYFHESNLIEGYDSPEMDLAATNAWRNNLMRVQMGELTHAEIQRIQRKIVASQDDLTPNDRGYYRSRSKSNVRVGEHVAPDWSQVYQLMDQWLKNLPNMTPKEAHLEFERIHPFVDGNGRTGRLLMWWHEARTGRLLTPITYSEREQYYAWFKNSTKIEVTHERDNQ